MFSTKSILDAIQQNENLQSEAAKSQTHITSLRSLMGADAIMEAVQTYLNEHISDADISVEVGKDGNWRLQSEKNIASGLKSALKMLGISGMSTDDGDVIIDPMNDENFRKLAEIVGEEKLKPVIEAHAAILRSRGHIFAHPR